MRPTVLWRFPGPIALLRVLDGEAPTLHWPDADRVFLADRTAWDWPGLREFGALTIFEAERLSPEPGPHPGWWLVRTPHVDTERVLYVPDEDTAEAVSKATSVAAARLLLPPNFDARVAEARRALSAYDALAAQVEGLRAPGARERLPPALREALDTPLHLMPKDRRVALRDALEAIR